MGRPRKPTRLLDVMGAFEVNPGRARKGEPIPGGSPRCPAFLTGGAKRLWSEYAPPLTKLGILTFIDSHMFAAWCCLTAEFEDDPGRMSAARISQMRGLGGCFGLDASARTRLLLGTPGTNSPGANDPAEKYFNSFVSGPRKGKLIN